MKKYWTMKNGEDILIKDMSDSHLNNTIKLLERRYEENDGCLEFAGMSPFNDDFDYDIIEYDDPEDMFPILKDMKRELKRRKK